ncbi:MAG: YifB family Mg chelatase-like AAA ATPase [Nitrospirae bacterium]|nr:YifB family Mg chelatase-like AAA ATPase [Nitrospirota bacterium]
MLARVFSSLLFGMDASVVEVEVDMVFGLPLFTIVGLPDTAVRESKERVRAALRNAGFKFPTKKITVNLAPANIKKEGALYDLPVAVAILCAEEIIDVNKVKDFMLIGELSLDGRIKPVRGALSIAILAKDKGFKGLLIPESNAAEAGLIKDINIYGVESLSQVISFFNNSINLNSSRTDVEKFFSEPDINAEDLSDVKGQDYAKRALEVAAAGGHNILMIGPPGSGKTMLAKRFTTILPQMRFDEVIETTKLYSLTGSLNSKMPLLAVRPFRVPHHTISYAGMVGGGHIPRPGEISLAHNGVLFIDELPEFRRDVLEVLRQPVENGYITVTRSAGSVTYPSRFILVCAMNPCPCGHFMDYGKECKCTALQIRRYRSKVSGPLLDRIDMHISLPPVSLREIMSSRSGEPSVNVRNRVDKVRDVQLKRYYNEKGVSSNAEMKGHHVDKFCRINKAGMEILETAISRLGLSARAYDKVLKVSRTIADLDSREEIMPQDISEAIGYRALDRGLDGI